MQSVFTALGSLPVWLEKQNQIRFVLRFLNDSTDLPTVAQVLGSDFSLKAGGCGADGAPHLPQKNPNPPLKHRYA